VVVWTGYHWGWEYFGAFVMKNYTGYENELHSGYVYTRYWHGRYSHRDLALGPRDTAGLISDQHSLLVTGTDLSGHGIWKLDMVLFERNLDTAICIRTHDIPMLIMPYKPAGSK